MGNAESTFYNNFALGGSKIVKRELIPITENKNGEHFYHSYNNCRGVSDDNLIDNVITMEEAVLKYKAYPCLLCN